MGEVIVVVEFDVAREQQESWGDDWFQKQMDLKLIGVRNDVKGYYGTRYVNSLLEGCMVSYIVCVVFATDCGNKELSCFVRERVEEIVMKRVCTSVTYERSQAISFVGKHGNVFGKGLFGSVNGNNGRC